MLIGQLRSTALSFRVNQMDSNAVVIGGTVAAGLAVLVALFAKRAIQRYLKKSKEKLLLKNRQPTIQEWAEYEAGRDAFLNRLIENPTELSNDSSPHGEGSIRDLQWHTPYDLVPGRYDGSIAISDYLDSLRSENDRTGQMVVETLLTYAQKLLGASVPLPLTWFMPKKLQSVDSRAVDVLQMLGILSPLQLSASADGKHFMDQRKTLEGTAHSPKDSPLPNVVVLSQLDSYWENLEVPGCDCEVIQPKDVNTSLFPGLKKGWSPLRHHLQPTQAVSRRNKIVTELCNRLMMNELLDLGIDPPMHFPREQIRVELPNGDTVTTLHGLVDYLQRNGCHVRMYIRSAAAIFGACFTAEKQLEHDKEPVLLDVPFTIFARTGVYSETLRQEAIAPVMHSGIQLEFSGTLTCTGQSMDCACQYYLSLGGLCGWNARNGIQDNIPWNEGKVMSEWIHPGAIAEAITLCVANTAVYTSYAQKENLPRGGYALTGVCGDSVAAIQYLMDGSCSLYPLLALPRYKLGLAKHAIDLAARARSTGLQRYFEDLGSVIPLLPSDCVLDSSRYADTLDRISESLPWEIGSEPFVSTCLARAVLHSEYQRVTAWSSQSVTAANDK